VYVVACIDVWVAVLSIVFRFQKFKVSDAFSERYNPSARVQHETRIESTHLQRDDLSRHACNVQQSVAWDRIAYNWAASNECCCCHLKSTRSRLVCRQWTAA